MSQTFSDLDDKVLEFHICSVLKWHCDKYVVYFGNICTLDPYLIMCSLPILVVMLNSPVQFLALIFVSSIVLSPRILVQNLYMGIPACCVSPKIQPSMTSLCSKSADLLWVLMNQSS